MMHLQRVGFIGAGGMVETVLLALAESLGDRLDLVSFLVLPEFAEAATHLLNRTGEQVAVTTKLHTDLTAFLKDGPELVVECAGHAAVRQYGRTILRAGVDFLAISTGVFADDAFRLQMEAAANARGAKLILSAGAVGGIDILAAARLSGLYEVVYSGRKSPNAWRNTPAEKIIDLEQLDKATIFYEGTARQSARDYPQNANVAATIALAGIGFDRTRVCLIADPSVSRNVHEISVRSGCADFVIKVHGQVSPANPKTSLTAGYSLAKEILNRRSLVVI